jgi:hypothetical protein
VLKALADGELGESVLARAEVSGDAYDHIHSSPPADPRALEQAKAQLPECPFTQIESRRKAGHPRRVSK